MTQDRGVRGQGRFAGWSMWHGRLDYYKGLKHHILGVEHYFVRSTFLN